METQTVEEEEVPCHSPCHDVFQTTRPAFALPCLFLDGVTFYHHHHHHHHHHNHHHHYFVLHPLPSGGRTAAKWWRRLAKQQPRVAAIGGTAAQWWRRLAESGGDWWNSSRMAAASGRIAAMEGDDRQSIDRTDRQTSLIAIG